MKMMNGSLDYADVVFGSEFRYSVPITVCLCLAYLVVFLLGVLGNIFVVMVVFRSPKMRSSTNLFIANLACADLLVIVVCLPFTLVSNIMSEWTMGWYVCKTVPYLQGVSVNASVNTLVAISVERCCAICYPLKSRWHVSTRACRRIILGIWLVSLTVMFPWAVFFKLQPLYEGSDVQMCVETWPTEDSGNTYFIVANLIMCYLLPLSVITVCYLLIWRRVFLRRPPGVRHEQTSKIIHKSKVKVVKMLLTVIIIFAFSWLPLYLLIIRIKFGDPVVSEVEETIIFISLPFAQWLGASNSCINPVLYAYFNRKFRLGFKGIMLSRSCCTPLYYAPSGSDIRTMSSKQSLLLGNSLRNISVRGFYTKKTRSCATLFDGSVQRSCSNYYIPKKNTSVSFPDLKMNIRSVSMDYIYKKSVVKECTDTFL